MIGVYATREDAIEAVARLALQPGFCDHPSVVDFDADTDMQGFTSKSMRSAKIIGRKDMQLSSSGNHMRRPPNQ
jgi:hypothetical protein